MTHHPTNDHPVPPDEKLLSGDYVVDIGGILQQAWELFVRDLGAYLVVTLVHLGIMLISCGLAAIVAGPLFAGLVVMSMKSLRGEPVGFDDAFSGFRWFVPLFLLTLVKGFLVLGGSLLCVLPGIYLAVAWMFTSCLVIDRGLGFMEAMSLSMKVVNKKFFPLFGLLLILGIISGVANSVAVGGLFSTPFSYLVLTATYARIFGLTGGFSEAR